MESDEEGFLYPIVHHTACNECRACVEVCPALGTRRTYNKPRAYACISIDQATRLESSSGGVFTLLANVVLGQGGVVFGAAFDNDFSVVHKSVEHEKDLGLLRGSKYVQSKIGESYRHAIGFLRNGRTVLFTGTPCQVAGLKSLVEKQPWENKLLTVDFICHGVPSPQVWRKYVGFREMEAAARAQAISFRSKETGWKRYSMLFRFDNGVTYRMPFDTDPYMRGFLQDLFLRPSCYVCKYRSLSRQSDITLGDFWGIGRLLPSMDDDRGTSLVLVQTQTGQFLFNQIQADAKCVEVDAEQAVAYNPCAIKSGSVHPNRRRFFDGLDHVSFPGLVSRCCPESMFARAKRTAKWIIRKVAGQRGL